VCRVLTMHSLHGYWLNGLEVGAWSNSATSHAPCAGSSSPNLVHTTPFENLVQKMVADHPKRQVINRPWGRGGTHFSSTYHIASFHPRRDINEW